MTAQPVFSLGSLIHALKKAMRRSKPFRCNTMNLRKYELSASFSCAKRIKFVLSEREVGSGDLGPLGKIGLPKWQIQKHGWNRI